MKNVTYRGAVDPRDHTTRYRIGEHLLVRDVQTVVPDSVADDLVATKGHRFEVEGVERSVSAAAAKLAGEKNFDLDQIEGDSVGVEDVRAAIEAVGTASGAGDDQAATATNQED